MSALRRFLSWLVTPRKDTTQESLHYEQSRQGPAAEDHAERSRRAHLANLPEAPDLTDDPGTDVPQAHPGVAQHVDLTAQVKPGEQAPSHLLDVGPSDWDLLSDDEKALFEQITPRDESRLVAYPAPAELTTQEWVTEQLAKAGYSEAYHLRFLAFRRVGIGMSMRHLGDLKRRADEKDPNLSVHDLIALRQRGIA